MMDGPAFSSVLTLASGMGDEENLLLDGERLMGGRISPTLLLGDASSPVVMMDGISCLTGIS
jgi:hypothetical protein